MPIRQRSFPESVVNVGNMSFEPGAFNIVPGRVTLDLEFRSDTMPKLEALETKLLNSAAREAERFGLSIDIKPVGEVPPRRWRKRFKRHSWKPASFSIYAA